MVESTLAEPIPALAGADRVPLRLVLTTGAAIVGVTVVVFGGLLLLALSVPAVKEHIEVAIGIAVIVFSILGLTVLVTLLRRSGVAPRVLGVVAPSWRLLHLLWQIPSGLVLLLLVQAAAFLLLGDGIAADSDAEMTGGELAPSIAILVFASLAIVVPVIEELWFRGVLWGAVRARWGTGWAILATALVFAIAHGVPILLPYFIALGLCLALLRAFHGSLWGSLIPHVVLNGTLSAGILMALG